MKKLLLTFVVLMGVSATTFANNHAPINSDLKVKSLNGLRFKVSATNLVEKSVVRLKDIYGYTLYKEIVEAGEFAKILNLVNLPDGQYKIVVTTGDKTFEEPIKIQTELSRVLSLD